MHRSAPTFTGLFHGFRLQTAIMEALTGTYGPFRPPEMARIAIISGRKQELLEVRLQLMHRALF